MTNAKTILIVDDEQNNRDLLQRYIKRAGHDTLTAPDGITALDMAIETPPDLIILDWMMPDLSGIDVLRAIREHHNANELPIIMCTALDEADFVVAAMADGANDFVSKPVNPVVLKARISSQLERCDAVRELGAFNTRLEALVAERTRALARMSGPSSICGSLADTEKETLKSIVIAVANADSDAIAQAQSDARKLLDTLSNDPFNEQDPSIAV